MNSTNNDNTANFKTPEEIANEESPTRGKGKIRLDPVVGTPRSAVAVENPSVPAQLPPNMKNSTASQRAQRQHSISSRSRSQQAEDNLADILGSTLESPDAIVGLQRSNTQGTEMTGIAVEAPRLHASAEQRHEEALHHDEKPTARSLIRRLSHSKLSASRQNSKMPGATAVEPVEEGDEHQMVDIYHLTEHNKWVVLPTNPMRAGWDLLVSVFVLYFCWKVPFLLAFPVEDKFHGTGWFEFEIFLLCFFWLDIVLNFRTAFIHSGHIITDDKEIAMHYIKSWFIVDIIATFPWEFVIDIEENNRTAVKVAKIFKLSKLLRIGRIIDFMGKYFKFRHIILWLFLTLLAAHWFTCFFYFLIYLHNDEEYNLAGDNIISVWQQYVDTLTEVVLQMFGIGVSNKVFTSIGIDLFSLMIVIIGQIMLGFLFASIFVIINSTRSQHDKFRSKMENIISHMVSLNLPDELQGKIHSYYDYLWANKKGSFFGGELLFEDDDLNDEIKKAVGIHLIHTTVPLRKIPMFDAFSDQILAALAQRMKTHIFMPGDYICRKGEYGTSLYLISKGIVEVLLVEEKPEKSNGHGAHGHGHGGHEKIHEPSEAELLDDVDEDIRPRLTAGAVLGEVGLLTEGLRSASVRAVTIVELAILQKEDLLFVLGPYPQHLNHLALMAIERLEAERSRRAEMKKNSGAMGPRLSDVGEGPRPGEEKPHNVRSASVVFHQNRLDQLHAYHDKLNEKTNQNGAAVVQDEKAEEPKKPVSLAIKLEAVASAYEDEEESQQEREAFTRRTASILTSFGQSRAAGSTMGSLLTPAPLASASLSAPASFSSAPPQDSASLQSIMQYLMKIEKKVDRLQEVSSHQIAPLSGISE